MCTFTGGSSYSGGCIQSDPIDIESGITPTSREMTLPGGRNEASYSSGVGVGGSGIVGSSGSYGGNGSIVLTFSDVGFVTE